mmetsp:Transcript_4651/g.6085  ORF Transcript_4651/g.6085 Transcript_4651/m.6085 type:complete len:227 (+) Transcript_4651:1854-2534(+)
MHRRVDHEPGGSRTFLTSAAKSTAQCQGHCQIKIRIIHNCQRVFGPHFHLNFGEVLDRSTGNAFAHWHGTCKGNSIDLRAFDQTLANFTTCAHHEAEQTFRDILTFNDFNQGNCRSRGCVRRLPDHRVAIAKRRRDFPGCGCSREVPGADDSNNTNRFAAHVNFDTFAHRVRILTNLTQSFSGVICEELTSAIHFALAFCQRLAFFTGQQRTQLFRAGHHFVADGH